MSEHGDEPVIPDPVSEQELLAAEYVMGALSPQQARAVEALALSDVTMAASIAAWEARLAPLSALVPPEPPPPELWDRLALAAGLRPSAPPRPAELRPLPRLPFWRRTGFWQATTAGALALAASLAVLLPVRSVPVALVAALSPAGGPGATYLVRVGADGTAVIVAVGGAAVAPGRALELWAVTAGTTVPVSMGLLPAEGQVRLAVPRQPGTRLLVTEEPEGGSGGRGPTGPVVYAGALTAI